MERGDGCGAAHIVLTGPMGSGKTTVGRELSHRLRRPFFDSDVQIETEYGTTSGVLAAERGVGWLHEAEAEALERALQADVPSVVAAAASIADLEGLDRFLSGEVFTVLLDGRAEVIAARSRTGHHRRSVADERYRALTGRRRRALVDYVDMTVDVTSLSPHQVVEEILARCR